MWYENYKFNLATEHISFCTWMKKPIFDIVHAFNSKFYLFEENLSVHKWFGSFRIFEWRSRHFLWFDAFKVDFFFQNCNNIGIFLSQKWLICWNFLLKIYIFLWHMYSMWLTQQNVCRCTFKSFYNSPNLSVYCLSNTACRIHIASRKINSHLYKNCMFHDHIF